VSARTGVTVVQFQGPTKRFETAEAYAEWLIAESAVHGADAAVDLHEVWDDPAYGATEGQAILDAAFEPVYQAATLSGEESARFPHTLDGMRSCQDVAVLMAHRTGLEVACQSVMPTGDARVIRVYNPATLEWRTVLGGELQP
jgi:hypothetical protein